jgi:hypothetical protein
MAGFRNAEQIQFEWPKTTRRNTPSALLGSFSLRIVRVDRLNLMARSGDRLRDGECLAEG